MLIVDVFLLQVGDEILSINGLQVARASEI